MKKIFKLVLLFLVIFSFNFTNYLFSQQNQLPTVKVKDIKEVSFDEVLEIIGSIKANESVDLSSVVSEKIKLIRFEEGSYVKKNQILVELENDKEKAILKQIQAELEEAKLNFNRAKELLTEGNVSQSMLDKRLMEKKKLEGKYEETEAILSDLIIKAPFDGIIGTKNFSEGSFIKTGEVIASIYDISKVKLDFYIPENFVNVVKKNQDFKFSLPSLENKIFTGNLFAIDPFIDSDTRTFKVVGLIKNNNDFFLKPGMMANIKLSLDPRKILVVPEGSIIPEDDKSYLYLVRNNNVKKVLVETGNRFNGLIEIKSEIDINSKIIYEGTSKVRNGSKVKIVK